MNECGRGEIMAQSKPREQLFRVEEACRLIDAIRLGDEQDD